MSILRDRVVVITGASSGIGEACAAAFLDKGAKVVLAARRAERLEALAARLAERCPECPPAQISSLPAVLAAHAGLGVLAVIVGESSTPGN